MPPAHQTELPLRSGTIGPKVIDIRKLYDDLGVFTFDPGFTADRHLRIEDHLYRRRRGHPALSRLSDRGIWPSTATSWRSPICCSTASCRPPTRRPNSSRDITLHTMVHEQIAQFFSGFRRDAHPMAIMCGVVGALSAFYHDFDRHQRPAPAHDRLLPADRQDADHRRHGVQIFDRPALHVSAERSGLCREFPAHDLCRAVRGLQGQPGPGEGDGPHLHPARRPRAERLDLDRAPCRLVGRQSVRLHRRRHRLAVGPGAWRRQRGGAEDADPDRQQGPHPRIHQARQGQERSRSR